MKIFEIQESKNSLARWKSYYLFGRKIYTRIVQIYGEINH